MCADRLFLERLGEFGREERMQAVGVAQGWATASVLGSTSLPSGAENFPSRCDALLVNGVSSKQWRRASVSASAKLPETMKKCLPTILSSSVLALVSNAESALALTRQNVDDAFTEVEELTTQVTGAAESAYATARAIFDQVTTTLKPGLDVAVPFVQKTTETVTKFASPIASDVASQAKDALKSAGLDTEPVLEVAKSAAAQTSKVIDGAKPIGSSVVESLLSADPTFLAEAAGGLLLIYWFAPSLISTLANSARGYKGDLTAPQALDRLSNENFTLVDVRTEKEKAKSGIPSLPRNAKSKYASMPVEEFTGKIRGQLRNSRKVEAEVVAIKVASLKSLNRGSKIVVMDGSGEVSKIVARSLKSQGFKNAYVIIDGFEGSRGWLQSRLGTETSGGLSFAEIVSPSRIIPASTKRFSTSDPSSTQRFKLLPGGSDE